MYLVQWGESYDCVYEYEFESMQEIESWYITMTDLGREMHEGWKHGREGHWYEVSGRIDFTEHVKSKDMWNKFDPLN